MNWYVETILFGLKGFLGFIYLVVLAERDWILVGL